MGTPGGLRVQPLGYVIQSELPAIERERVELIERNAAVMREKGAIEGTILKMISDASDVCPDASYLAIPRGEWEYCDSVIMGEYSSSFSEIGAADAHDDTFSLP